VLRINLSSRPELLDPQKASAPNEIAVLQLAYEGLTRLDEMGRIVPGAAEKWEYSPDGKTLTFHLRSGLKRADGTVLTARDFEYSFKRALDPRVVSPDMSFLDDVRGAISAYSLDRKSKAEEIDQSLAEVGVRATDDATLVVSFDRPTGYWPTLASTWIGWPADRGKVEKEPDAWWFKPENHNGNGPFRIAGIHDQVIRLESNPNYWGGKPRLDRIEFSWVTDPDAALESFRQGQLDVLRITAESLGRVRSDASLARDLVRYPAASVTALGLNVRKPPFSDRSVRRAFSQAIDREALGRELLQGLGRPYLSWVPPGLPGYEQIATVPDYDPKAAIQTLVDAGYGTPDRKRVDCSKLGTLKLSFSNTPRNLAWFQFLAGNLMRVFACPVLLDPVDPETYAFLIQNPQTTPQFFILVWQEEYPHPQNWLFLLTCNGVFAKRTGYCNRDVDAALAAANQELDPEAAVSKYQTAQRILSNDAGAVFLWNSDNAFLIRPNVKGLREHLGTGDNAWPGQFGPVGTYDINPLAR
jgi:oligopeptide transport system substrate-binding protein